MILTKKQIITEIMRGICLNTDSKFYVRVTLELLSIPDNDFIPTVLKELNWNLEQ